jgi:single-stranded DNA-binding protein
MSLDLNVVVLGGRLAAPPEIRQFDTGARLGRYLVTVRTPDRVDVLPVTIWDPPDSLVDAEPCPGTPVWTAGAVQRRFWSGEDARRSRIEVIADQVCLRRAEDE